VQFELNREYIDLLREHIEQDQKEAVLEHLAELHSADIAEIYTRLDDDD
jgi:hypothetical protein